jgi:hypothetical protein
LNAEYFGNVLISIANTLNQALDDAGCNATGGLPLIRGTHNRPGCTIVNFHVQQRPDTQLRDYGTVW